MPIGRNFEYLEKNGVLQFFEQVVGQDNNAVHGLGNIINNGVGNVFNAGLGSNIISTGSLLAAAASPLWAPLLVGKKRRKRSEDVSLNEIQQANMQYYTKLIMSDIKKAKNNYY